MLFEGGKDQKINQERRDTLAFLKDTYKRELSMNDVDLYQIK